MNKLSDFYHDYPFFFIALAIYIPLTILWIQSRRRMKVSREYEPSPDLQPLPLSFGTVDYLKAFISWLFLFLKIFTVRPGLYYVGERDENAPLLVTCNNFLTIFLLTRKIANRNVRLLVIDTNGINVWCSAGEGKFSAEEIIDKAGRYGLIKDGRKTEMILPKLCLSGVKLSDLQKAGIKPVIGPMYAKDLPRYLDEDRFQDRVIDHVTFGLQSRIFTALPTAVQFLYWFAGIYIVTFWMLDSAIIGIAALMAFSYPILFPFLPGKQFAVKGISLGIIASVFAVAHYLYHGFNLQLTIFWILFTFATSIFIGLSFTGNSPLSNYDKVRKETAAFLPVVVILYLMIIPVILFL